MPPVPPLLTVTSVIIIEVALVILVFNWEFPPLQIVALVAVAGLRATPAFTVIVTVAVEGQPAVVPVTV